MTELLTAAQMRAIEQAAIASGEVTGLELMERAGRGVVAAIFAEWPEFAPEDGSDGGQPPNPRDISTRKKQERRAAVLCGPGNNGGDGFVVARLLHEAGWAVEVFLYGEAEKLPPDARVNYERWLELGAVQAWTDQSRQAAYQSKDVPDVVVDALFGTGLSRPMGALDSAVYALARPASAATFDALDTQGAKIVAIDTPSGLCADSGRFLVQAPRQFVGMRADLTVTFAYAKLGHYIEAGPMICGLLRIVDIGVALLPAHAGPAPEDGSRSAATMMTRCQFDVSKTLRGHKYSHGHALVLSGGVGKGGAARLGARGALRVGAGAVTVGCPPAALIENAAQLNAVMLQSIKDADADADALGEVLADKRINALCLGPGMGTGAREAALLGVVLGGDEPRPTVLDADSLTLLAGDEALFAKLHDRCVLTPHAGEFARLFPDLAERLDAPAMTGPAYSKVDATREAAKRAGCVVLFKGPDTVIADPSGRCSINASVYERAAPWLATAGSGDVLAGFITGLLARGFNPMRAAETGAWLHTECALSFGPGLIAEDLADALPKVFRALGV